MTDTFARELQTTGTQPAVLPHAMRYFVSATADDLPPLRMRDQLAAAGIDVEQTIELLERDPALMEAAALAVLQAGWDDATTRELAEGALGAAQAKLPVVEAGLVAIVATYGMWLTATRGRRSHQRVIRRGTDGSWEETETTDWYGPSGPLRAIAGLLGVGPGPSDPDRDELPESEPPPELPPADHA
jgi:hypothetical protein